MTAHIIGAGGAPRKCGGAAGLEAPIAALGYAPRAGASGASAIGSVITKHKELEDVDRIEQTF